MDTSIKVDACVNLSYMLLTLGVLLGEFRDIRPIALTNNLSEIYLKT